MTCLSQCCLIAVDLEVQSVREACRSVAGLQAVSQSLPQPFPAQCEHKCPSLHSVECVLARPGRSGWSWRPGTLSAHPVQRGWENRGQRCSDHWVQHYMAKAKALPHPGLQGPPIFTFPNISTQPQVLKRKLCVTLCHCLGFPPSPQDICPAVTRHPWTHRSRVPARPSWRCTWILTALLWGQTLSHYLLLRPVLCCGPRGLHVRPVPTALLYPLWSHTVNQDGLRLSSSCLSLPSVHVTMPGPSVLQTVSPLEELRSQLGSTHVTATCGGLWSVSSKDTGLSAFRDVTSAEPWTAGAPTQDLAVAKKTPGQRAELCLQARLPATVSQPELLLPACCGQ